MASLVFTDDIGSVTLTNGKPAPADRFSNWVPTSASVGDAAEREGDGAIVMLVVREDWGATFELRKIPVTQVDLADRLSRHLKRGGTCTVNTGDSASRSYATCGLASGAKPSITQADARNQEYTLALALVNLASSPTQMICRY